MTPVLKSLKKLTKNIFKTFLMLPEVFCDMKAFSQQVQRFIFLSIFISFLHFNLPQSPNIFLSVDTLGDSKGPSPKNG